MSQVEELDIAGGVIKLIETTLKMPSMDVDLDADFETFGVNSLIAMELMENIEVQFLVELTPAQFSEVNTISQLVDLIERLVAENTEVVIESTAGEQVNLTPVAAAVGAATNGAVAPTMRLPGQRSDASVEETLAFIRQKHGVDLGYRAYSSVDEVVDTLVNNHSGELMNHYGLANIGNSVPAQESKDIAIVGLSCRFADAPNASTFWDNLINEKNSMREIPKSRWDWQEHFSTEIDPQKTISKWGALIDDVDCFDAAFFGIDDKEAQSMDPQQRLLLEETYKAIQDAGCDISKLAGSNTGVFVGYEYSEYEQYLRRNVAKIKDGPIFSSSSPTYYLANRLSFVFDFCGPSESINVNCASSALAINSAYYSLLNKESDLAIAAGVSLNLFVDDYIASSQYGILSATGTSGVFDNDADGFTRGEGVAAIVLKRLADAQRDNDNIYSVIKTSHQNNRGFARDISEIKYESITKVIEGSFAKAQLESDAMDYIEVDGYASKWGDSFEFEGIKAAFSANEDSSKTCALGSLKGNIGNVESVNGLAAVIKLAMALKHKQFPATISKKSINTFIDIDSPKHPLYIAETPIAFDDIRRDEDTPIRAGVNAFADSGTNLHIILEEYMGDKKASKPTAAPQLFVFSAADNARLVETVEAFAANSGSDAELANIAYTLQVGRAAMPDRLAVVASSHSELMDKLAFALKTGIKGSTRLEKKGIYHANVPADGKGTASMVTEDMVNTQIAQSVQSQQWGAIAALWANGVVVEWSNVWTNVSVQKLSLPGYPFAKTRHWVEIDGVDEGPGVPGSAVSADFTPAAIADTPVASAAKTEDDAQGQWHFYLTDGTSADSGTAMDPLDKVELFFRQASAVQLDCATDDVALDINFIELGMDSIGIAEVINKADILFGINLSPSVVFKYPEIGTFSEYLVETYADKMANLVVSDHVIEALANASATAAPAAVARTHDECVAELVIPMQTKGRKRAIFAVPGADGSILSFQQLSQTLGQSQPFYGLESVGLDGATPPLTSIEAVAAINIEALKGVQPKGPYRLAAYSNGGMVAFEMIRMLQAQGDDVTSLSLLDSLSPLVEGPDMASETVNMFKQLIHTFGGELDLTVAQLEAIDHSEWGVFLYNLLCEQGYELPQAQFMATYNVSMASEAYCVDYQPAKLDKALNVTLYKAVDGYQDKPADYGWDALLVKPVVVEEIKATHYTVIDEAPIKVIAASINPAKK